VAAPRQRRRNLVSITDTIDPRSVVILPGIPHGTNTVTEPGPNGNVGPDRLGASATSAADRGPR
ncbi:MAG: hypothetical protein ACRCYX_14330, partial [Dermatophilaceae bacterium]